MLAVDWSGDAGFKIGKGSSEHLALAVVSYNEDEIRAILADLRHEHHLDLDHEFHFTKEPDRMRAAFMAAHVHATIEAIIIVVDKRALSKPPKLPRGNDLVTEYISSSAMELSRDAVENAVMVIDGGKDDKALCVQVREALSRKMKTEGYDYRLGKVRPYRSHRSDGVMLADMLSGAARHTAQGKAPNFLAPLKRKTTLRNIP